MAKKSLISADYAADINSLVITVDGIGAITVAINDLSDDITSRAMRHGLVQKISDAAAIPKADLPADAIAAAKVKFEAMQSVASRLFDGDWSKRAGDGSGPVTGVIFRAYVEFVGNAAKAKKVAGPTEETLRARYEAMTRGEQLALRNVPAIATIIERLKSERGATAAKVDVEGMLADLGI